MGTIIKDFFWSFRNQELINFTINVRKLLVKSLTQEFLASAIVDELHILLELCGRLFILKHPHKSINVELSNKFGVLNNGCRVQISHNIKVFIARSSGLEHVLTHLNGCLKSIVESESVTDRGQILYVFFHVGPKEWGIRRTLAVSQLYTVGVHVEGSP